jgi:signal transduction histidine kinase
MNRRLLQRNTRFLLIWLPLVLLICSIAFCTMLVKHAHHMQEKQLMLKQTNIWNAFISRSGKIDRQVPGEYDIIEGTASPHSKLNESLDTAIYYADIQQLHPFKKLTGHLSWNGKNYLVTTYISSTEFSHLIIKVFITEAFILVLLLIAIVVLNRKSSGLLWKPFLSTMEKVNTFEVTRNECLILPAETGTTEFNELNKAITALIARINTAYHNQKQFVENASHEMQTPLAIIRSKLELLINQPGLTEKNAALIGDITEANDRLSQMNRTLLLLAKIENNQFPETEPVEVARLLKKILTDFKNHYEEIPLISATIENTTTVHVNRVLIDVLISNLIKNAIEHNQPKGNINITLSKKTLIIENTGPALSVNPHELFERFKKGSHQTKTTGLGLALVKQICNLYQFRVNYNYSDGWHRVMVIFDEAAG